MIIRIVGKYYLYFEFYIKKDLIKRNYLVYVYSFLSSYINYFYYFIFNKGVNKSWLNLKGSVLSFLQ